LARYLLGFPACLKRESQGGGLLGAVWGRATPFCAKRKFAFREAAPSKRAERAKSKLNGLTLSWACGIIGVSGKLNGSSGLKPTRARWRPMPQSYTV